MATISVLGVDAGRVPAGSERLLREAALVVGSERHLARLAPPGARRLAYRDGIARVLDAVAESAGDVCVLASGDPGFFGIVRSLRGRADCATRLVVRPAPTSVATAFARLAIPWDDAVVVSAHARAPHPALHTALRHPKVAILTDDAVPPRWFAERLAGTGRWMAVAQRLGEEDERISSGTAEELRELDAGSPNVIVVLDPAAAADGRQTRAQVRTSAVRWALPETAFEHRAGLLTKREVRALALAELGPGAGDLVWDVGCGSGSVAIESALLGAAAVGVDRDPRALELTARNAAAHEVPVAVVAGEAPAALRGLPDPDAAFVGGGGDDLGAIVDVCAARARRVVVCTLALVERVGPVLERLTAAGLGAEATMVHASRVRPMPGGHRLAAENATFVVSGRRA